MVSLGYYSHIKKKTYFGETRKELKRKEKMFLRYTWHRRAMLIFIPYCIVVAYYIVVGICRTSGFFELHRHKKRLYYVFHKSSMCVLVWSPFHGEFVFLVYPVNRDISDKSQKSLCNSVSWSINTCIDSHYLIMCLDVNVCQGCTETSEQFDTSNYQFKTLH